MKLLGKEIKFVATAGFRQVYEELETAMYVNIAYSLLQKYPYDMFVFEMPDDKHFQVRVAGYRLDLDDQLEPEEELVIFETNSLEIKKFWLKIDNYNEYWVGTFLFPEEY